MVASPTPHPTDSEFARAYSDAWTNDSDRLLEFFTPDGAYTDVAMSTTYHGKDGILRFHRWMLKFAPDSEIEFYDAVAADGLTYLEWTWRGSVTGPLRLPTGALVDATGNTFSSTGIAACRYDDSGTLTSHRDFWDVGLLVAQLGQSLTAVPG